MANARRSLSRRGTTLVEILTVTALFLFLITGLVAMSSTAANEWANGSTRITADNAATLASQSIAADIRPGLKASVNTAGDQLTVTMPYQATANSDYDRYTDGKVFLYYLDKTASILYRKINGGAAAVVQKYVTGVSFAVAGTNGSQITMQITSLQTCGTKKQTAVVKTQVYLRNLPPTS